MLTQKLAVFLIMLSQNSAVSLTPLSKNSADTPKSKLSNGTAKSDLVLLLTPLSQKIGIFAKLSSDVNNAESKVGGVIDTLIQRGHR
jgi:hypothetical protein